MPLGIALLLIFILYLIDKHQRWRIAAKLTGGILILCVLAVGGIWGWENYDEWRESRQAARQRAQDDAAQTQQAAQKQAELSKPCKDWEDKHPIGSPPDKLYTDQGGLLEKTTNKHYWIVDPPQGCEGPLEADYSNRNIYIIAKETPSKPKIQLSLSSAVVVNLFVSIVERCAFDVGIMPCGGEEDEIAKLNKGDRVQILSDKLRAPDGTEIYKVKFQQWTGRVDASNLSLEK